MDTEDKTAWLNKFGIFALGKNGDSAYWVSHDASTSIKVACVGRNNAIDNLYNKIKEEVFRECNK